MNRYLQYYQAYSSAFIIVFAVVILLIAAMWRIFSKAGRKGWHCLIPIYNTYVLWDIAWEGKYFFIVWGVGLLSSVLINAAGRNNFTIIISAVFSVFALVMSVKMAIRLAHRFGKSTAFGVIGLLLFPYVGYCMLSWGSADYNAARDTGDGVLRMDAPTASSSENKYDDWGSYMDK